MTVFKEKGEDENLSESLRQEAGFCTLLHGVHTGWLSSSYIILPSLSKSMIANGGQLGVES